MHIIIFNIKFKNLKKSLKILIKNIKNVNMHDIYISLNEKEKSLHSLKIFCPFRLSIKLLLSQSPNFIYFYSNIF